MSGLNRKLPETQHVDGAGPETSSPRFREKPISAVLLSFRRLLSVERIPGTLIPAILLAASLTVLPTALLFHGNRFAIAESQPFATALIGAGLVAVVLTLVLSRWIAPHAAGGLVGASGYAFFSLSFVPGAAGLPLLTVFWVLFAGLLTAVVVWLLSNSRFILTAAAVGLASLSTFLIVVSFTSGLSTVPTNSDFEIPESLAFTDVPAERPNVYMFILDGFANPDISAEQFGEHDISIDLDDSMSALEQIGFERDSGGTANYGQTILSVPSTLNAEFHHTADEPLEQSEVWSTGVAAIRGNNALVHSLRDIGYEFWFSSSGIWAPSSCDPRLADRCIDSTSSGSESQKAIWWSSPLRWQLGVPSLDSLSSPASVVDDIVAARSSSESETPYFAFAHIVSPHQPYRYEPDCSLRDEGEPGSTLSNGYLPEFRQLYADQTNCLGDDLVSAMTQLLEIDPTALIFVQADHGSEFEAERGTTQWPAAMVEERLGILRATHLPQACRVDDPAAQSAINTVPIILGCLSGTAPDLIEPRYFLTELAATSGDIVEADEAFRELLGSRSQ